MRQLLTDLLEKEPGIKVIGTARNGTEALAKTIELKPSVVTLDIEMPKMDGLTALQYIMKERPVPVIMISAMNKRQADIVMKALEMGAVDFIPKTSGTLSLDIDTTADMIIKKIKEASQIKVKKVKSKPLERIIVPEFKISSSHNNIIAIGASTGGPKALLEILAMLPRDIPAAILIVQHMPEGFTKSLAERLNWQSSLEVKEGEDGERIMPGTVYIAPGNKHMVVRKNKIKLTDDPKVNFTRPSVDVLMESVAKEYRERSIGVVLTGMGRDGGNGLKLIKEKSGRTIAQNEETCAVFGMPKAAIDLRVVDKVKPLNQISSELINMLKEN
jgi:two-component system chemotaxis response regulator CheB